VLFTHTTAICEAYIQFDGSTSFGKIDCSPIENISVIGISPSIAITPLAIYILFRVLFEEIISKLRFEDGNSHRISIISLILSIFMSSHALFVSSWNRLLIATLYAKSIDIRDESFSTLSLCEIS